MRSSLNKKPHILVRYGSLSQHLEAEAGGLLFLGHLEAIDMSEKIYFIYTVTYMYIYRVYFVYIQYIFHMYEYIQYIHLYDNK